MALTLKQINDATWDILWQDYLRQKRERMTLKKLLGIENKTEPEMQTNHEANEERPALPDLVEGQIYYLNKIKGFGFIESSAIPFTRIFFHWQDLVVPGVKFPDLRKGRKVQFKPLYRDDKEGYRAIMIRVLPEDV